MRAYNARARYNLMRHDLELRFRGLGASEERENTVSIAWMRYAARRWGMNPDKCMEDVITLATEYHPALDWIESEPWDGTDRIDAMVQTVRTVDMDAPEYIRTWLLQCAAALVVGYTFRPEGVLTFQGAQGCGKTQWVRSLVPAALNARQRMVRIGSMIDPHNRDSIEQAVSHWICELGEVDATFKKADVASLKAFIDLDRDVFRKAYGRTSESYPRRTVFFASVNRRDFLADATGNRRWWTVAVDGCVWEHGINTQQLWAQLVQMVRDGESWRLSDTARDSLTVSNDRFAASDPLREDVLARWVARDDEGGYGATLDEVCASVGIMPESGSFQRSRKHVAHILGEAGFGKTRKTRDGRKVYVYGIDRV